LMEEMLGTNAKRWEIISQEGIKEERWWTGSEGRCENLIDCLKIQYVGWDLISRIFEYPERLNWILHSFTSCLSLLVDWMACEGNW
jgi:hypothetical protein